MNMEEYVRDWASLPVEILVIIARFLTLMEDFMVFGGVCTSWRTAAPKDVFVSVGKVPLLMLAEKKGSKEREFYSLSKRKICTRIPLPDTIGRRCMDVGFGWIVTLRDSGEVCLLKPLSSKKRIRLPNFKNFPKYKSTYTNPESNFIRRAWLIDNPAETSNFTFLVLVNWNKLGFWRNGDKNWTKIKHRVNSPTMDCTGGEIHILDLEGNLLVWDPRKTDLSNPQGRVVPVRNGSTSFGSYFRDYVVASTDGSLLLITRNNTESSMYLAKGATLFIVKRLDLSGETPEFIEIKDLGTDAVFLGFNAAVSVDATEFPGVLKPNCIYFTDDCNLVYQLKKYCPNGGGKDMGIYNVADHSIERFGVESYGRIVSPQWIFPSF